MPEVLPGTQLDVCIVGAGPAGLTAAIYARRAGMAAMVLEEQTEGGQMATAPKVENYPGLEPLDGFTLSQKMADQARALGADVVTARVTALDLTPNRLSVKTGDTAYSAKTLILAMGARRRRLLGVPGEEKFTGRGVSWCAVCDGHFFKGKPVAVIGGGRSALEDALYLSSLGCEVTILHRREEFRASKNLIERIDNDPRITVITPVVPCEILGDKTVTGLSFRHSDKPDGRDASVKVEGVFICIGATANTDLLQGALETDKQGRVTVGEDTKTTIPGVFVAGDIRRKPLYQIVTATADGAVAADAARAFVEIEI